MSRVKKAQQRILDRERATKAAETANQFDAKVWAEAMFGSIPKAVAMIQERERKEQEDI